MSLLPQGILDFSPSENDIRPRPLAPTWSEALGRRDRTRDHGVRRGDRWCRAGWASRRDQAQATRGRGRQRPLRSRAGEGLTGRRPYFVRRRDRSGGARSALAGLARTRLAARDGSERGPFLLSVRERWFGLPLLLDAAAHEQSWLLYRKSREPLPLAWRAGRGSRRGNLPWHCRYRCDL